MPRDRERNNNGANVGKETSASMLPTSCTEPPPEGPHAPILPLSHRTEQERKKRAREPGPRKQARVKTETQTRAETGRKCMPGRRASQRRVEERVKNDEATKEIGGSQQPSKGRAQGRGHGKHTERTTPQQSTREGGTRGTGEGQPKHHGTRRTDTTHTAHTHTRTHGTWPAGPGSPPRGRAAGKGRRLNTDAPRHPHGAQPPTGPPHPHTRTHSTWVADPDSPPGGPAVGGGRAPDPRRPSQRRKAPPRGRPSATPTARNAGPQGRMLWGRCWVPTPAPTAPETHGSQNPDCPPQRTGGRQRDSA